MLLRGEQRLGDETHHDPPPLLPVVPHPPAQHLKGICGSVQWKQETDPTSTSFGVIVSVERLETQHLA